MKYRIQYFIKGKLVGSETGGWFTHDEYHSESIALLAVRDLRAVHPDRQWRIVRVEEHVIYSGEAQP